MRRLLIFLLFMASLAAGLFFNSLSANGDIFRQICDLTESSFYKEGAELDRWVRECRRQAARVPWRLSKVELAGRIQDLMGLMNVSHFNIYSPSEDKKMWQGKAVDTGIRARYVEDHLVVHRVLAASGAEKAGIRPGDEILEIEGASQVTPWGAQNRAGGFTVLRGDETLHFKVEAAELKIDGGPSLRRLSAGTAVLEIPSFRSEYFGDWNGLGGELNRYGHVIIDLRENAGGNFVAMLRALSTFHCERKDVGALIRPRKQGVDKPAFDDNTEDGFQIQELEKYRSLGLVTYEGYGCYRGRVTVLIGPDTASVSEIFAHSFFSRPNSRVWGQPSAGDVVLAVWYDLPAMGPGYSVSIPEAVYLTPEAEELENRGVAPQKEIYYNLRLARAGLDTFIEEALQR